MRVVLALLTAIFASVILMLAVQRYFGVPPVNYKGSELRAIELRVKVEPDGALKVHTNGFEHLLASFEEGTFAHSVFRNMRSDRQRNRIDIDGPYKLIRYETGELALQDLSTGASVYVRAFGSSNAAAFDSLFSTFDDFSEGL